MTVDAIVLLHGFLGTAADWSPARLALEPLELPVHAPDLPGHGSTPLDVAPTDIDSWARWLDAHAPPGRLFVAGYSMGGRVALAWAEYAPDRVHALALVSSSPGIADPEARAARAALDTARAADLRADLTGWLDAWYRQPLFAPLDADATLRAREVARRSEGDADALADVIEALSPGRVPDRRATLLARTRPTLAIAGEHDVRYARLVEDLGVASRLIRPVVVPGGGHALLRTHGAEVGALLASYAGFAGVDTDAPR